MPANKFKIERHMGREISHEVSSDEASNEDILAYENQTRV